jgi:thioredoxin reductase (NADPH)
MEHLTYIAVLAIGLTAYVVRARGGLRRTVAALRAAAARPAASPGSGPTIDPLKCIGCGACVLACPEQRRHLVLGLINNTASLISPRFCVGDGACRGACPVGAIRLGPGPFGRWADPGA